MAVETEVKLADFLVEAMLSGEKRVTIRKGHREFAPEITIAGYPAITEAVEYFPLIEVPFGIFLDDGFNSFLEVIEGMSQFYPDITPDTEVTVLHFHLKDRETI